MEVTIKIPDNCELVKNGDTYVVREKEEKDSKPKSWEEFCNKYPIKDTEYFIDKYSNIWQSDKKERNVIDDRNICASIEEAGAFLALMQLRQLRKAWIGDWEQNNKSRYAVIVWDFIWNKLDVSCDLFSSYRVMSFPTEEMALDFIYYFGDLLRKAKVLL